MTFMACNTKQADSKPAASSQQEAPKTHPKYPHIPIAEKGITVVKPDGWDEQTFAFHLDYCGQMLANLEENYEPAKFCECFISKIQYYYEPIYFKEAYEDQAKWNQECLEVAAK